MQDPQQPLIAQVSLDSAGLPAGSTIKAVYPEEYALYVAIDVPGLDNDVIRLLDFLNFQFNAGEVQFKSDSAPIGEGPVEFATGATTFNNRHFYVISQESQRIDSLDATLIGSVVFSTGLNHLGTTQEGSPGVRGLVDMNTISDSGNLIFVGSSIQDKISVYQRDGASFQLLQTLHDTRSTGFRGPRSIIAEDDRLLVLSDDGLTAIPRSNAVASTRHTIGFQNLESLSLSTGAGSDSITVYDTPLVN